MTTLPIEATRTASKDLPLEKAVAEAMAEEMGKSHVWDQGFESMLPSEQHAKKAELAKTPEAAKALHEHYLKGLKDPSKSTKKPEDFLEKSDKGDGKSEAASVSEALKDSGLPKSIIDGAKPASEKEADEWQAKAKAQVESPEGQKALDDVEKALESEHYADRDTLALIGGLGSTFAIGGSGLIATGITGLGATIGFAALPVMVGVVAAGVITGAIVGEVSDRRRKKEREAEAEGTKKTAKDTRKELERILTAPTMKDVEAAAPFIDDKGKLDMAKLDKALKEGKTASRSDLLPSEQHASKTAASYFDMFFKEKRIPSKVFEVKDSQGVTHSIPNQVVIDMIKQTRGREKASIEATLRKIDYGNGDVNHFLAFLAKGLAESYSGALRLGSQQEAEKLEAEAEANEQQAQADRAKAEAAQMREASVRDMGGMYDWKRQFDAAAVHLLENDEVTIYDPDQKLRRQDIEEHLAEAVATEWNDRYGDRGEGDNHIGAEDVSIDMKWYGPRDRMVLDTDDDGNPLYGWEIKTKAQRYASQTRTAGKASGLYGYTKGTQRDVEASVRKAQRRANSIAKVLYARDERSVVFLKAHAKRANSKSARLILAAMKNIGPRVASDKTAGPKLTSDQIAEIKGEMVKSGVPVRFMKGGGSLNIETGHVSPRGVNVIHQIVYWNFTKETAKKIADWLGARASFDKSAALLPSERHASIFHGSEKEQLEYVVDALRLAGKQGLRVDGLPRKGALAAQSKGFADAERGQLFITPKGKSVRLASEEKIAGGLYGHPTKTARLALVACSDLRAYVGEVAFSLHSRRTAKYAKMTGFLKEHGKKSRCAYSRMILDCYPDAPVVKAASSKIPASEMLKKAFVPDSVDGWVEWADGTRTATTRRRG